MSRLKGLLTVQAALSQEVKHGAEFLRREMEKALYGSVGMTIIQDHWQSHSCRLDNRKEATVVLALIVTIKKLRLCKEFDHDDIIIPNNKNPSDYDIGGLDIEVWT